VRGVEGLRIADASVIPIIPSCNTHAPVTAIGERAADFILHSASDWSETRIERQCST
jgi:choline dehydrogenase-like flavoprotein